MYTIYKYIHTYNLSLRVRVWSQIQLRVVDRDAGIILGAVCIYLVYLIVYFRCERNLGAYLGTIFVYERNLAAYIRLYTLGA